MTFTILLADVFLWFLSAAFVFAIFRVRRSKLLRARWGLVFEDSMTRSAFIIFVFYLFIALIDSVHFQTENGKISSILDLALADATRAEKTYSSPFAYRQFSKESLPSGLRDFPRLKHAPADVETGRQNFRNIFKIAFQGILIATLLIFVIAFLWRKISAKNIFKGANRGAFFTICGIVFFVVLTLIFLPHYHIFGTDKAGTDVFYQALKSVRTGMIFGVLTTLIALPPALIFGLMAGFFKGRVDDAIQYLYTTINAIPGILLIAALVLILQAYMDRHADAFSSSLVRADLKLLLLCAILALTSWTNLCRIIRAETLKLSEMEFIQAGKIFAVSNLRILFVHLLPNVMHLVLIAIVLDFSGLVLVEAILSYVGIGVDINTFSWGNMINAARLELSREQIVWWPLASAFVLMFTLVLCANIFADRVQKVFDPRGEDGG